MKEERAQRHSDNLVSMWMQHRADCGAHLKAFEEDVAEDCYHSRTSTGSFFLNEKRELCIARPWQPKMV